MAASTTPATAAEAEPGLGRLLLRRGALAVALILVILIPAFGLMAATGQPAATYSALGTIIGLVAVVAGGLRIGTITAVVVALLAPLAVLSGLTPITGAALMALMTMIVGRLSVFGLHRATMLVPVLLAWPLLAPVPWLPTEKLDEINAKLAAKGTSLADVLTAVSAKETASGGQGSSSASSGDAMSKLLTELRLDSTYLNWLVLFFFVGAIVPVILGWFLRHRLPSPELTMHSRVEAVPYTVTITVLAAGATYYFLDNPKLPGGAFFIAVILVLTQVGSEVAWRLTVERVIGTLLGVGLFAVVNQLVGATTFTELFGLPFPLKLYSIGILFAVVALVAKFSSVNWLYYLLIVPTTAYLNSFSVGEAAGLGKARLLDNVVGAVLVIVATLITLAGSRLYTRRYPTDPNAPIKLSPA